MSSIINGQTLLEYESIYDEISKNKFEKFLNYLFETILPRKVNVDRDTFSKIFYFFCILFYVKNNETTLYLLD